MDFHTALLRKLPSAITVTPIYAEDSEDDKPEARNKWECSRGSDDENTAGISIKTATSGNLEFTRHPELSISSFEDAGNSGSNSKDSSASTSMIASSSETMYSMCSFCDKLVTSEAFTSHLAEHLAEVTPARKFKKQRISTSEDSTNFTDESRRNDGLYSCRECAFLFTSSPDLKEHLVNSHGVQQIHRCSACMKTFSSSTVLQNHERIHNGTAPYPCTLCSRTFNQPVHLKAHLRRHTGETPYKCQHCPKAYADSSSLAYHMRSHTGERPYTCPRCPKGFSRKLSLNLHLASHAEEQNEEDGVGDSMNLGDSKGNEGDSSNNSSEPVRSPRPAAGGSRIACQHCEKTFGTNSGLRRHQRNHHEGSSNFKCKPCSHSFSTLVQLQAHERAKHSNSTQNPRTSAFSRQGKDAGPELRFICARCSQKFIDIAALNQHKLDVHPIPS